MKSVEREHGPIDILVTNAGSLKPFLPFWKTSVDD
jgi:NADP-dependent 3-hydroxy acid dehydrogenase YdfG